MHEGPEKAGASIGWAAASLDPPTAVLERICRIAQHALPAHAAAIQLLDAPRDQWTAQAGFAVSVEPIALALCVQAMQARMSVQTPGDAMDQPRGTAAVDAQRFVAAPLLGQDGPAVGALCIAIAGAAPLSATQLELLQALAATATELLAAHSRAPRHDPLTGLPNRQQLALDLKRESLPRVLVLLDVLDVRTAHRITRVLGLNPFESYIREISQRLTQGIAGRWPLYHIGVARLAFVSEQSPSAVIELLERLQPQLNRPIDIEAIPITPITSAGIVPIDDASAAADAIRRAMCAVEDALHQRKPWALYDEKVDAAQQRAYALVADLPAATREQALFLQFQPRVELRTRRVSGVEALVRWRHPHYGLISPAEFVPAVERTTSMRALSHWVIEQVTAQLARWGDTYSGHLSFNLTASDFLEGDIVERIADACQRQQVDATRLEVEITEGEWLSRERVAPQLGQLRALGVTIAIDDFGSGFSNFSYLAELGANALKIDKSLVDGIEHNGRRRLLVGYVIALAQVLGYRTVAEGIETEQALRILTSLSCDEGQGFLLSEPLDAEQLPTWIDTYERPQDG